MILAYATDEIEQRRQVATVAVQALERVRGAVGDSPAERGRLQLLFIEGQWAEGRALMEHTRLTDSVSPWRWLMPEVAAMLPYLQGDTAEARAFVHAMLPDGVTTEPGTRLFFASTYAQHLAALLALDAGDLAGARAWIEAHDRWLAWSSAVLGLSEGQALWARYHRQAGDAAQAYMHAERAFAHATEPRQPLALIAAHRLLGELDTEAGRFADAETHMSDSLALANACQAPYERALTLLAMAELRAMTGKTDEADGLLAEIRTICEPLGAKPTLARVDALAEKIATQTAQSDTDT